jgi:hypothetical protein
MDRWYAEKQTADDMSAENIANLVEVNIRYVFHTHSLKRTDCPSP